jgi:hypothetical protein
MAVLEKPPRQECLNRGVLKLSQVSLLHVSIDKVAVRMIARLQVLR